MFSGQKHLGRGQNHPVGGNTTWAGSKNHLGRGQTHLVRGKHTWLGGKNISLGAKDTWAGGKNTWAGANTPGFSPGPLLTPSCDISMPWHSGPLGSSGPSPLARGGCPAPALPAWPQIRGTAQHPGALQGSWSTAKPRQALPVPNSP